PPLDLLSFPTRRSSDLFTFELPFGFEAVFGVPSVTGKSAGKQHGVKLATAHGDDLRAPVGRAHLADVFTLQLKIDAAVFGREEGDRKSTRLNSSHSQIS